ncbi:MAG TPA: sodium:solute symporter family protein [Caulobacterales bacterium]|nr:sodium:solute symporter family protein [Caulobacterales bacterium]
MLSPIDIAIIITYLAATIGLGFWVSKYADKNLAAYFLAGKRLPWYVLGLSNASGQFDVAGTMWMVSLIVVYGLKSVWIPWLWPVFNQIFLMAFLAVWLRRSNVLTGAEWVTFRFGDGPGARASHFIIVLFALITVLGYMAFGFLGIGKLVADFSPWRLSDDPLMNDKLYGVIVVALTTLYMIKGGMFSVVLTEVLQFVMKSIVGVAIAIIAMQQVTPQMIHAVTPAGWDQLMPRWSLDLDWASVAHTASADNRIVAEEAQRKIASDGYSLFTIFLLLMLFKGVFQAGAGPAPNYDMQRLLSARSPKEAALISFFVNVVLYFPRYLLITGLGVLALCFVGPEWTRESQAAVAAGRQFHGDFEAVLPFALSHFIPTGLLGLTLAGLLSAFMAAFSAALNAAPAYLVSDIYKKYVRKDAPDKHYVFASMIVSFAFAAGGTAIGFFLGSINDILLWITSGLYGGYTAANVIKWYWWRMNGWGYCAGMAVGIISALALAKPEWLTFLALFGVDPAQVTALNAFPAVFALCVLACILGSYAAPATDMERLKDFYRKTRPWGFWQPVHRACEAETPGIARNKRFWLDAFNVVVGVIWQTAITASPIFLVIQEWTKFAVAIAIVAACSIILKFSWYDTLEDTPKDAALA